MQSLTHTHLTKCLFSEMPSRQDWFGRKAYVMRGAKLGPIQVSNSVLQMVEAPYGHDSRSSRWELHVRV